MQQLGSSYAAWSLILSIFIMLLSQAYCSILSCDQINPKGIIILIIIILVIIIINKIIMMLYNVIYIFSCQYNTGVDSETINVKVECLHNGYVTDNVAFCQIEYLCYSDQFEQVCFHYACITPHYYTNLVIYI